jgi:thiosulfate/3-mercaptopyruvate sulfurtransferase
MNERPVAMRTLHLLLILLFSSSMLAQPPAAPLLVDVDYVAKHQTDPNVVLLEVGSEKSYATNHIAGARLLTVQDVSSPMKAAPGKLSLELLPAEELRTKLTSLGISDGSHIIIYSGKDGPFQLTTRVIFALEYMGLGDHTSLLNGGLAAWTTAGKPVTTSVPDVTPGRLTIGPAKNLVADADLVRSIAEHPDYKLIDSRTPNFYDGADPSFGRSGHIPGAVNIPFNQVFSGNSEVDLAQLNKVFSDAGVKTGDTIVTYCHLGAQATATLFAARVLGHPVMLYDGSFQDWATNNRGDVVK